MTEENENAIHSYKSSVKDKKSKRKGVAKSERENLPLIGQYLHLASSEIEELSEQYGENFFKLCVEKLDNWIDRQTGATKIKYLKQNHAACIRGWVKDAVQQDLDRKGGGSRASLNSSKQKINLD